jgi:hypothetical protein
VEQERQAVQQAQRRPSAGGERGADQDSPGASTSRCVSRGIAEETSLGLQTVCTILDQQDGVDRTTIKQLQRIDPDPARERVWRQMRQALPREIAAVEKANAELRQVAKGLKIKHHVTA